VVRIDGFAWMFGMLVSVIGALVVLYARYYLSPDDPAARFYSLLLGFMGAMLGVVLSGNLVQLVVFWELTSLFSFLLIGYWHHRKDARRGARMAFMVTAAGGLACWGRAAARARGGQLRARCGARGRRQGARPPALPAHRAAGAAGHADQERAVPVPLLAAACDGGADAGVRLPALGHDGEGRRVPDGAPVAGAGRHRRLVLDGGRRRVATLLLGAYAAMFQNDLKALLAYSTISHLGLITLLLGLNSPLAAVAAVFHMMNHATFKASLFMAVGIIDHETGTRDMRRLHGLYRVHARHGQAGDHRLRRDGGRAAAQRLPVQGDVLRRDRAHAVRRWWSTACRSPRRWPACSRWSIRCASATTSSSARRRATARACPTNRSRWMRVPIELLVLACLVVGIVPEPGRSATSSPPRRGPSSAASCRSTAWRSGTASMRRWP
jgi:multicomponent K+:H+ antiporter subunit A